MDQIAYDDIVRSRIKLIKLSPFFGRIIFLLEPTEKKDIPTAATDGENLFYNPEFIKDLNPKNSKQGPNNLSKITGTLMHEVLHVALGHLWRRGDRNFHLWNMAADYVVNLIVREEAQKIGNSSERPDLPDGVLINEDYRDMTVEQIYDLLLKNAKFVPMANCSMFHGDQESQSGSGSGDDQQESDGSEGKDSDGKQGKDRKVS